MNYSEHEFNYIGLAGAQPPTTMNCENTLIKSALIHFSRMAAADQNSEIKFSRDIADFNGADGKCEKTLWSKPFVIKWHKDKVIMNEDFFMANNLEFREEVILKHGGRYTGEWIRGTNIR